MQMMPPSLGELRERRICSHNCGYRHRISFPDTCGVPAAATSGYILLVDA